MLLGHTRASDNMSTAPLELPGLPCPGFSVAVEEVL